MREFVRLLDSPGAWVFYIYVGVLFLTDAANQGFPLIGTFLFLAGMAALFHFTQTAHLISRGAR